MKWQPWFVSVLSSFTPWSVPCYTCHASKQKIEELRRTLSREQWSAMLASPRNVIPAAAEDDKSIIRCGTFQQLYHQSIINLLSLI